MLIFGAGHAETDAALPRLGLATLLHQGAPFLCLASPLYPLEAAGGSGGCTNVTCGLMEFLPTRMQRLSDNSAACREPLPARGWWMKPHCAWLTTSCAIGKPLISPAESAEPRVKDGHRDGLQTLWLDKFSPTNGHVSWLLGCLTLIGPILYRADSIARTLHLDSSADQNEWTISFISWHASEGSEVLKVGGGGGGKPPLQSKHVCHSKSQRCTKLLFRDKPI